MGGRERALTLFLRQALKGSLHHMVAGLRLSLRMRKAPYLTQTAFSCLKTLQHPVVEFASFLWEE